jgi:hypothetical protein
MFNSAERITANTFRWLVGGIFFSIFYDLFWFAMKSSEYNAD